jgi:hypothetical protein
MKIIIITALDEWHVNVSRQTGTCERGIIKLFA